MTRLFALLCAVLAVPAWAQSASYAGPIIDVHMHNYPDAAYQQVPMAATTPFLPPELSQSLSPPTAAAHLDATLAEMTRLNITRGFVSMDVPASVRADELGLAKHWVAAGGGRIVAGLSVGAMARGDKPDPAPFQRGDYRALGELQLEYEGAAADEARFEPWFAMAEANDIPVGIHTGTGPPRSANGTTPAFRTRFGDPRTVEEVLIRHPKLRVWLMHAGWPYLAETKIMLEQYPELYADVSVIDWVLPPAEFASYLKALVDAGYGDRLMFGSDQMLWPQAIGMAVRAVNDAPYLTTARKQAILHDNAARFLRVKE